MERQAKLKRETRETCIEIELDLAVNTAENRISTGIPFMDHMLTAFAQHGKFALHIAAQGDLDIDAHHTMEDLGLALGQAGKTALGDKRGITRFGTALIPLDEALARVVIDLSGRPCLSWRCAFPESRAGGVAIRLFREFFQAWVNASGVTLHVDLISCEENHHGLEAIFKAFGRAYRQAVALDPDGAMQIPSTKGILE